MRTILYFQASGKVSARQKLEGVYAFGRGHGWDVQVIEPVVSAHKAGELVRFWTPDGVIVECGSEQNHFDPAIFGKTPTVFRAATGRSPLEAIQDVRRAKAEELLADPTRDRTAIANLCGYGSANALANFLRRYRTTS